MFAGWGWAASFGPGMQIEIRLHAVRAPVVSARLRTSGARCGHGLLRRGWGGRSVGAICIFGGTYAHEGRAALEVVRYDRP